MDGLPNERPRPIENTQDSCSRGKRSPRTITCVAVVFSIRAGRVAAIGTQLEKITKSPTTRSAIVGVGVGSAVIMRCNWLIRHCLATDIFTFLELPVLSAPRARCNGCSTASFPFFPIFTHASLETVRKNGVRAFGLCVGCY